MVVIELILSTDLKDLFAVVSILFFVQVSCKHINERFALGLGRIYISYGTRKVDTNLASLYLEMILAILELIHSIHSI